MKILMLSWEYPPKSVGGLSNHVYNLSINLSKQGNEVHVITFGENNQDCNEDNKGVHVHRVLPYNLDGEDFIKWVMHLNFVMAEEAVRLINKIGKFQVIHAHDWLTLYSAKLLKTVYNIPMICTIHATEYGRNSGIRTEMQRYISSAEWMLTYEAWKVIACSDYMEREIREIFSVPEDKLFTIPNGVELNNLNIDFNEEQFRSDYAKPDEKIVFFLGRHVYEKGIQLLVEAAPDIVNSYSKVKFIIAGEGPMTNELKEKVKLLGLDHKFLFIGYIEELTKSKLLKCADAAVFPSLYEPFGIAALEAMAAGCPVVVSNVGGLSEIVKHEVNGLKAAVGSKDSLRDNIVRLLTDESFKEKMDENLIKETLSSYSWDKIAVKTLELYGKVMEEANGTEYEVKLSKAKKSSTSPRKKKIVDDENDKEKAETVVDAASKPKRTRKKNI